MTTIPGESQRLHRYAVFVAICTALLFVNGPAVSSNDARPLYLLGQTHLWSGPAVSLLIAGLAVWLSRSKVPSWLRRLGWGAVVATAVQGWLGFQPDPMPASVRISHALLGQLLLSTTVAMAVFTSRSGNQNPAPIENGSLLRFLATATPALVLLQVILGAGFRHGVMGVAPHMFFALLVALFLGLAMAAIAGSEVPVARPAGIVLAVIACVQVLLGFALLTMQAMDADPSALIVATAAHATLGALTLAGAVAVAILVRRAIRVSNNGSVG